MRFPSIRRRVPRPTARRVVGRPNPRSPSPVSRPQRECPYSYFNKTLEYLGAAPKIIVELGSMRSPMDHNVDDPTHPCCLDGHSTYLWARAGHNVISVDIDKSATANAVKYCNQYPLFSAVTADGIEFLKNFSDSIDLLFLDAWDVYAGIPYAQKHLEAFQVAKSKLSSHHLVAIDDTDFADGGKGGLVIPLLASLGYRRLLGGRLTLFEIGP